MKRSEMRDEQSWRARVSRADTMTAAGRRRSDYRASITGWPPVA
jgi:hypothetical protein